MGKNNKKCVDCKEYSMLIGRSGVYHRTVYCHKGNKAVSITTNRSIACQNFEKQLPFIQMLDGKEKLEN